MASTRMRSSVFAIISGSPTMVKGSCFKKSDDSEELTDPISALSHQPVEKVSRPGCEGILANFSSKRFSGVFTGDVIVWPAHTVKLADESVNH